MKISLRDLQYFATIADEQNFGRAAARLHVSQPTLSMQFKKLEEQLGGALLERLPSGTLLTPLGRDLLPLAREMVQLADEIERRSAAQSKLQRLRIGIIPTLAPFLLPKITTGLKNLFHGRQLSLIEVQTAELVRMVKEGSIDIALLSTPLQEAGVVEVPIFTEPFLLAVHKDHPLAQKASIDLADVREEKMLLLSEGHCLRNQALEVCHVSQPAHDSDFSATSIETLRSMVALGAGVTLVPQLAVRPGEAIRYVPLADPAASREIGLLYRSTFFDKEAIESLRQLIHSTAAKLGLPILSS